MARRGGQATSAADRFEGFVSERSAALLRIGWLLTGDEAAAHDLVQSALLATWTRWAQVVRQDAPEAYVRRVMMSTYLSWRRRRWTGERPSGHVPLEGPDRDALEQADVRSVVGTALAQLPRGQRAVVVLRYFADLSEAQTAAALGCSTGTVKSQGARALARLRADASLDGLWNGQVEK